MRAFTLGTLIAISSLVGCAANGMDEEDAAANAAPSGKSDGASIPSGPYTTSEIDYVADEPVLAWFHDDGKVDFTWFVDDSNTTEYAQGTYKLYKYGGHDRIRITDADGNVLVRSDRTATPNGGFDFGGESWFQGKRNAEDLVDCLAIHVRTYESLEESLTEWEYPDVSVRKDGTSYSLELGASSYDAADSTISVTDGATELVATSTSPDGYVSDPRLRGHTAPRRSLLPRCRRHRIDHGRRHPLPLTHSASFELRS